MANTYLNRTSIGTPTNRKKFTGSAWVKKARSSANEAIIWTGSDSNNWTMFKFGNSNLIVQFRNSSSDVCFLQTNRVFRDTNSWYHIVCAVDTTQATASNRVKLYVNGVQETSFSTETYPSQNIDLDTTTEQKVGVQHTTQYFDGSMSHVHFIDGTAYDASAFGETDATTGEWEAKTSPSVTYGTNGFFILKDGNGITDQSGEGNDFTLGGGTLTDLKDNPDNVFATGNPIDNGNDKNPVISKGNNSYSVGSNVWRYSLSTLGMTSGKFYMEQKQISNGGNTMAGFTDIFDNTNRDLATNSYAGGEPLGIGYMNDGQKRNNDTASSYGDTFARDDIIGVALDVDNKFVYFSKNGVWQNSGDPTSGSSGTGGIAFPITSNSTGVYMFLPSLYGGELDVNYGNGYFGTTAVASAGTNASENGIFEYDVPTGYTALSTKGLNL